MIRVHMRHHNGLKQTKHGARVKNQYRSDRQTYKSRFVGKGDGKEVWGLRSMHLKPSKGTPRAIDTVAPHELGVGTFTAV